MDKELIQETIDAIKALYNASLIASWAEDAYSPDFVCKINGVYAKLKAAYEDVPK